VKDVTYKCDGPGCKAARGEVNHWFLGILDDGDLTVRRWDAEEASHVYVKHLCGSACVLKFVSEWLSK
jgi:hypothetical protein